MTVTTPTPDHAVGEGFPDLSGLVTDHTADTSGNLGTELVDLPDSLRLTPGMAEESSSFASLLAAPLGFAQSLSAVTAASYADYEWMIWAADVLRAAGVPVIEHPGWKTRGRPRSTGRFQPRGLMWHHDASAPGPSPYVAKFIAEVGRPAEGIPAPLSQFWVCEGCNSHAMGTWHVLAAGRANHAGLGAWGDIGQDAGNSVTAGIETDNTINEATPAAMYQSLVKGSAALMRRMRSNPARLLVGHKEYALPLGRKNDPDDIVMSRARLDVAHLMAFGSTLPPAHPPAALVPFPGTNWFQMGVSNHYVTQLGQWLVAAGFGTHGDSNGYQPSPTFTEYDRLNVAAFQRSHAELAGNPDGYPGPKTWQLLQLAATHRR